MLELYVGFFFLIIVGGVVFAFLLFFRFFK